MVLCDYKVYVYKARCFCETVDFVNKDIATLRVWPGVKVCAGFGGAGWSLAWLAGSCCAEGSRIRRPAPEQRVPTGPGWGWSSWPRRASNVGRSMEAAKPARPASPGAELTAARRPVARRAPRGDVRAPTPRPWRCKPGGGRPGSAMPKSCAARQCCNRYSSLRKQLTFHR
nr:THAP domain-containing protein 3 isoform X2 [Cavia porcellus]